MLLDWIGLDRLVCGDRTGENQGRRRCWDRQNLSQSLQEQDSKETNEIKGKGKQVVCVCICVLVWLDLTWVDLGCLVVWVNTGDQGIVNDVNNGRVADLTGTDGRKTG